MENLDVEIDLDDLGLEMSARAGRQAQPVEMSYARDLIPADFALPPAKATQATIKKIRDTHHSLARLLAVGTKEADCSAMTGYTLSTISILKADPQFTNLVEFYRSKGEKYVADLRERMAGLGVAFVDELRDRLETSGDKMPDTFVLEAAKALADRTGHAPQKGGPVNVQVNVGLSERMERARERASKTLELKRLPPE